MDKTGIGALIMGLIVCVLGSYAIWAFLPDVIASAKGLIGIIVLLAGLMLVIFGVLVIKE
jgi:hypothetical protein